LFFLDLNLKIGRKDDTSGSNTPANISLYSKRGDEINSRAEKVLPKPALK